MDAIKIFFKPIGKVKKATTKENKRKGKSGAKLVFALIKYATLYKNKEKIIRTFILKYL